MWHGGRRWYGPAEVRRSKKGRAELGPGIYCTTDYQTARKHSLGGGEVRRLIIEPSRLLEQTAISLADLRDFVTAVVPRTKRTDILDRLASAAKRCNLDGRFHDGDGPWAPAENLVNLFVNGDLAHGARGLELARFLVQHQIDASFQRAYGAETWGVIFNPACIKSNSVVPSSEVSLDCYKLPCPITIFTSDPLIQESQAPEPR
jgi:hypothetical protein